MKNNKFFILNSAEYFLITAVLYYWFLTSSLWNPIAIGLLLILIFQIIFRNKVIGIIFPMILTFLCLYMILALISEVHEFESFNNTAQKMLLIGLAYFLGTIAISSLMFLNYFKRIMKA